MYISTLQESEADFKRQYPAPICRSNSWNFHRYVMNSLKIPDNQRSIKNRLSDEICWCECWWWLELSLCGEMQRVQVILDSSGQQAGSHSGTFYLNHRLGVTCPHPPIHVILKISHENMWQWLVLEEVLHFCRQASTTSKHLSIFINMWEHGK